jgi:hypothetical protein
MSQLNIVDLIEKNPITKLSRTYNNKLLDKIKQIFTGFEQQLFISSFYCYLNYDKNTEFVIDFDNIWKWLGFTLKENAKRILTKNFELNIDYKNLGRQEGQAVFNTTEKVKQNGGQNKQTIMLTVKCFKSLCLKAQTKKASEIHEYYMKLEEVLQETLEEETTELKLQLEQKDNIILEIKQTVEQEKQTVEQEKLTLLQNTKKEKQKAVEQAIIIQFPLNTECIYFGTINNTNEAGEKLIKFGHTNDLATRITDHRKKYTNFILVQAFRVQNKVEIENLIKTYPKIKRQIRSLEINGKNKTEIIAYDDTNFTIEKLTKYIKDIIHSKTYSIDNFNRLMKQNEELENEIRTLKQHNIHQEIMLTKKSIEINELNDKIESQQKIIDTINVENQSVYHNALLPVDDMYNKFNEFITSICIVRSDVEELSVNIEGRFRLWCQVKPRKEVFHSLKNYLDTRFKPKRIQGNHGYVGIKLKPVEYVKTKVNDDVENFIFQVCQFSDCGKILNSVLLNEYKKWKISIGKDVKENDMKELKDYLNSSPYALKSTVWTSEGSNEGYYGLSLKQFEHKPKVVSSTGKKVYKREAGSGVLLATWDTIAKAAASEGISPAKMSRCVKHTNIINDYYYSIM